MTMPQRNSKMRGFLIVIGIVLLVIVIVGVAERLSQASSLRHKTEASAIPDVVIIKAPRGPDSEEIVLPGNVQAWHEAPIYARTSGYLKRWITDIGAQVKAGDLIAEIETPEVDAQLHQAEADLGTAQANNSIAQTTSKRWQDLLQTHAVSKQDADEKAATAQAAGASLNSAAANLNRLQKLESFKRIVAPFSGVITARNTDTGALIDAGSGVRPELINIAETDKLRVYVQVPQLYVGAVKPDLVAHLEFTEHPGETFPAKLIHTADALDPVTRTLLIQLEVDNASGELLPGGYAEVHIQMPSTNESIRLPVNTLLFHAQGMQVATVDDSNHVILKTIVIGRDYGKSVEVTSGIAPDEPVILNPPDSLQTGQEVRIVTPDQDGNGKKSDDKNNAKDDAPKSNESDSKP